MKSVPALLLVLVLIAALAAWFLFAQASEELSVPGEGSGSVTNPRPREGVDPVAERDAVPAPRVPEAATPAPNPAAPAVAPAPEPPAAAAPNLRLQVRDATTRQPVAAFRWRLRTSQTVQSGDGQHGLAEVVQKPAERAELLIEATGYQPLTQPEVTAPATGEPAVDVEVLLIPVGIGTGITLQIHDVALQPLRNVQVAAYTLRPDNRELAWQLEKPLWTRRTMSRTEDRLVPPDLPPGEYGIRVFGLDDQGTMLPLVPYVRTFALTGSNGFVEDAVLEPGCILQLELVDSAGQPLDPAQGAVTLDLRLPGGPAVPRLWQQQRETRTLGAIDALPGPGVTWPAEPLAPGTWQLDVQVSGQPALQRRLVLRSGERQAERLVVQ